MTDITDLTIKDAGALLSSKQIKAQELTREFLKRAEKLNLKINY